MIQVKRFSHATFETPDLERQIDYFTQVVGLAVAARENGRAHLATKVGDLVVQLEKGDQARCTKLSFQVDPDTEFADIRKGLEAEGVRCEVAQRHRARHSQDGDVRGSEGHPDRRVRRADADRQEPAGRRHRAAQARPSGVLRRRAQEVRRILRPRAGLPAVGLDPGLVRLHALRAGPSHRQFRARQAHADASHRLRAEGLGADPDGLRFPRTARTSSSPGGRAGTGRATTSTPITAIRTTRSSSCSPSSTRCSTRSSAISIRGRGTATARRCRRCGTRRATSGARRRRRTTSASAQ